MGAEQFPPSSSESKQSYTQFAALDGIRGVAFVLVFVIHYVRIPSNFPAAMRVPFFLFHETGWFLVPLFFVLSGFLITRMLIRTRERDGYFRVFYIHRAIRIFPLYYLTIGAIALVTLVLRWRLTYAHLLFAVYLQNLAPDLLRDAHLPFNLNVIHLWSMAVEEQFYIAWPLAIWFLRSEKVLLRFCFCLIGGCTLIRLAWPVFSASFDAAYFSTATRGDAIILGAVMAVLHPRKEQWNRLVKIARVLTPGLWMAAVALTLVRGRGLWNDYFGVTVLIPLMNLIGAGFVVLAIEPVGMVNRFCSGSLICSFGKLSYGMYLFHLLYAFYIENTVVDAMSTHIPIWLARIIGVGLAFAITLIAAILTYRFVENPLLILKKRVMYGPALKTSIAIPAEPIDVSFAVPMEQVASHGSQAT